MTRLERLLRPNSICVVGGGGFGTWIAMPCAYFFVGVMSTPTPTPP